MNPKERPLGGYLWFKNNTLMKNPVFCWNFSKKK